MSSNLGAFFLTSMIEAAAPAAEAQTLDWVTWWMAGALVVSAIALLISLRNLSRFRRAPVVI